MKIGVLGVGHLAATMVQGLIGSGLAPSALLLSPRGKAGILSDAHGIAVASDNADLVTRCDTLILAVRPTDAAAAVTGLPWRDGQVVICVCAGVPLAALPLAPATGVRAMPLTAAEINASPTVCFPDHPQARAVLDRLGPVIPLASEADFEIATVNAAVYGWSQDLIRRTASWAASKGADADAMRQLVALTFVAAGRLVAERGQPMEKLLAELVTPGGITELGLRTLEARSQPEIWEEACEAVLAHLRQAGR